MRKADAGSKWNKILGGSFLLGALLFAVLYMPKPASAQSEYVEPLPSYCVSSVWDSQLYGWLAYQNNCGQPIRLTWFGRLSGGLFSADIYAGSKANTGFLPVHLPGELHPCRQYRESGLQRLLDVSLPARLTQGPRGG